MAHRDRVDYINVKDNKRVNSDGVVLQDATSVTLHKDIVEGQAGDGSRNSRALDVTLDGSLDLNLAISSMERVSDHSPYSSDNWEDSDHSDTDGDHSDSSDDDDPKSQVDRLIERGTLMFMDDENSALSSESESDGSDCNDEDSESDITDVSPLISASASPVGLSPVLPRRTVTTSPLALHSHPGNDSVPPWTEQQESSESTNMALLMQAVMELEKKEVKKNGKRRPHSSIHPIHDSPHHRHLSKKSSAARRKNMSFTNDEVRRIDHDNKILLKKIMTAHHRTRGNQGSCHAHEVTYTHHRPANATINRRKDDEKIRRENLILLRKIQEAKPSKEVVESRSPRHRGSSGTYLRSGHSLSAGGSCSLSARTTHHHHVTSPPRKETAL